MSAPDFNPDIALLATPLQAQMRAAARAVRLPLRRHVWRGVNGAWAGAGSGSSIDFQDHRPYLPGDDPRYIDWQAYARSGHYTMKLYREETAPGVDLALDVSPSMLLDEPKARRTLELFFFAVESARQARGTLRCYGVGGESFTILPPENLPSALAECFQKAREAVRNGPSLATTLHAAGEQHTSPANARHASSENATLLTASPAAPALRRIPWRNGSLRLWISDLLYPGAPDLHPLAERKGRGVLLIPWSPAEAAPAWEGNVEFIDCETTRRRRQRVHDPLRRAYLEAYQRHFQLWRDHARQLGIPFARIPSGPDFLAALQSEALPNGAVEPV